MKRVLISGGAGFIGTHVARMALNAGHHVRIFDNLTSQVHGSDGDYRPPEGAEFLRGDVTVRPDWEKALDGVDTLVHLAAETGTAQSMYEIDRYYAVNVQGTALLFDLLASSAHSLRKVILASSRSVYGEGAYICRNCERAGMRCYPAARSKAQLDAKDWNPKCPGCGSQVEPVPTREGDPGVPASIYAATKLAQEELVRVACKSIRLAHVILRLQNVYGEGQSLRNPYTGILSIFATRARLGLPLKIFEDGCESRDFVHVDDVGDTVLWTIENPAPPGLTMNVGSGKATPILQVAELLTRAIRSDVAVKVTGEYRIGDIRHNFADVSRLEEVTGLQPRVTLEAGIDRFSRWVQQQPVAQDSLERANSELKSRKLMG